MIVLELFVDFLRNPNAWIRVDYCCALLMPAECYSGASLQNCV